MNPIHLSEEQLVEHYYREASHTEHLTACADCASQFETLRRVLTLVTEVEVPEPDANFETRVWNRLRWKLDAPRQRRWQGLLAAAAMLAIAFFAGQLWRARMVEKDAVTSPIRGVQQVAATGTAAPSTDRLMFIVVSDHLDSSERMLVEIANGSAAIAPARAQELVSDNRMYRQTAVQRGDDRIADLLADLEPILLEIARAGSSLEGEKLADLQKRIESKGLLFKVRVVSAAAEDASRPAPPVDTNSL